MVNPSDEATGLPPLDEPVDDDILWALEFASGPALVVSPVDRTPVATFIVSVRGLMNSGEGSIPAQVHLAVPRSAIVGLRDRLDEHLKDYSDD